MLETARRARRQLADSGTRVALRGRFLRPYWQRRFHSFGRGSVLHKPIMLAGAHKISVGDRTTILTGCWLSVTRGEWRKAGGPTLTIGDRVTIQPFCTVGAAESLVIEDDVTIGSFSLVIDSTHRFEGPHEQVARNRPISAPVRIGRGTQIGERVAVLQGAQIGRHCVIGTNSVIQGRIPDYSIARGFPARIVGTTRSPDQSPSSNR
jgi:acetyltransferase-like isoleucine patch superfamily enzyme